PNRRPKPNKSLAITTTGLLLMLDDSPCLLPGGRGEDLNGASPFKSLQTTLMESRCARFVGLVDDKLVKQPQFVSLLSET
ncbi:MAG: hypothetical protein JW750_04975, partial [Anaerolineaceae bacterium]|nr:hypothetical protein [Anaerolineaceae bacterium]